MHHKLDVQNLLCPLPIIRLSKLAQETKSGDTITLIATDQGIVHDVPAWCRINNHKLISLKEEGRVYTLEIKICP